MSQFKWEEDSNWLIMLQLAFLLLNLANECSASPFFSIDLCKVCLNFNHINGSID